MTWGMITGWAEIICPIEVMDPGLVSKGFLIDPPEFLTLVLHVLLWEFTNSQDTKWGDFSDLSGPPGYYYCFGSSDEVLEGAMVQPVVPNQNLPLIPSKEVLGGPQIDHVLSCELGY